MSDFGVCFSDDGTKCDRVLDTRGRRCGKQAALSGVAYYPARMVHRCEDCVPFGWRTEAAALLGREAAACIRVLKMARAE